MTQLCAESTKAQRHELNIEILKKGGEEKLGKEQENKNRADPHVYIQKEKTERRSVQHIELGFVNISNGPYSRRRMQLKREMFDFELLFAQANTHTQMA